MDHPLTRFVMACRPVTDRTLAWHGAALTSRSLGPTLDILRSGSSVGDAAACLQRNAAADSETYLVKTLRALCHADDVELCAVTTHAWDAAATQCSAVDKWTAVLGGPRRVRSDVPSTATAASSPAVIADAGAFGDAMRGYARRELFHHRLAWWAGTHAVTCNRYDGATLSNLLGQGVRRHLSGTCAFWPRETWCTLLPSATTGWTPDDIRVAMGLPCTVREMPMLGVDAFTILLAWLLATVAIAPNERGDLCELSTVDNASRVSTADNWTAWVTSHAQCSMAAIAPCIVGVHTHALHARLGQEWSVRTRHAVFPLMKAAAMAVLRVALPLAVDSMPSPLHPSPWTHTMRKMMVHRTTETRFSSALLKGALRHQTLRVPCRLTTRHKTLYLVAAVTRSGSHDFTVWRRIGHVLDAYFLRVGSETPVTLVTVSRCMDACRTNGMFLYYRQLADASEWVVPDALAAWTSLREKHAQEEAVRKRAALNEAARLRKLAKEREEQRVLEQIAQRRQRAQAEAAARAQHTARVGGQKRRGAAQPSPEPKRARQSGDVTAASDQPETMPAPNVRPASDMRSGALDPAQAAGGSACFLYDDVHDEEEWEGLTEESGLNGFFARTV